MKVERDFVFIRLRVCLVPGLFWLSETFFPPEFRSLENLEIRSEIRRLSVSICEIIQKR